MILTYKIDFGIDLNESQEKTFSSFNLVMTPAEKLNDDLKAVVNFSARREIANLAGVEIDLQPLVQLPKDAAVDPRLSEMGILLEPGRLTSYSHPLLESVLLKVWGMQRANATADVNNAESAMTSLEPVEYPSVTLGLEDAAGEVFGNVLNGLLTADWTKDLVARDPLTAHTSLHTWTVKTKKNVIRVTGVGLMATSLDDWISGNLQWCGPTFKVDVRNLDFSVKLLNIGQCSKVEDVGINVKSNAEKAVQYDVHVEKDQILLASSVVQLHSMIQECKTQFWRRCVADEIEKAVWQQRLVACEVDSKLYTKNDDVVNVAADDWSSQLLVIIWWLDAGSKTEQMESVFGPQVTLRVHAVMRDHCAFGDKLRNRKRLSDEDRLRVEHDLPEVNELLSSVGSSSLIVDADGPIPRADLFKAVAIDVRRPLWIQLLQFVEFASRVLVTACCLPDNRRVDLEHARVAMQEIEKALRGVSRWFDLNRCTASDFGFKGTIYLSQALQACEALPTDADLTMYRERADLIYACFSGIKFTSSSDLTKLVSRWPLHDLSGLSDRIMNHKLRPNAKGRIVDTFNLEANGLFTDPVVPTLIEAAIRNQANEAGLDMLR